MNALEVYNSIIQKIKDSPENSTIYCSEEEAKLFSSYVASKADSYGYCSICQYNDTYYDITHDGLPLKTKTLKLR